MILQVQALTPLHLLRQADRVRHNPVCLPSSLPATRERLTVAVRRRERGFASLPPLFCCPSGDDGEGNACARTESLLRRLLKERSDEC